jgi:hypothetical protein
VSGLVEGGLDALQGSSASGGEGYFALAKE